MRKIVLLAGSSVERERDAWPRTPSISHIGQFIPQILRAGYVQAVGPGVRLRGREVLEISGSRLRGQVAGGERPNQVK